MTPQTRQGTVTAYYLGRPAALWRTALAARPTIDELPRGPFSGKTQGSAVR
jgi:hypothetical protein